MKRQLFGRGGDKGGAVAATVGLSLFALVAAGGIAFDYARLATLDTEMQNAADQAALAAATQLDQQTGAVARATAAAMGLLANQTLMANDNNAANFAINTTAVVFYATKADAEAANGANCPTANAVTADATAKFVCVRTMDRVARYALTPIAEAFSSGNVSAMAVAGLGSAICKVPPVMLCNPDEPVGNTNGNLDFNVAGRIGAGMRLVTVGNGPSAWAPGNFGYLDVNSSTSNPNVELREALGWMTAPGDCSGLSGVETRTGAGTPVTQALNTRFDIYEKANTGNGNAASCPTGSSCPPSINTVKDVSQKGTPNAAGKCGVNNNEWELPPTDAERYLPSSDTVPLTEAQADAIKMMGHPRDMCHAISQNGSCTPLVDGLPNKIGNGTWDRNAYFRVNYGWTSTQWPTHVATGSSPISTATPTRYQVYLWEIANRGATIGGKVILAPRVYGSGPNGETDFDAPVCSALQTPSTSGIVPGGTNVDRRRISAAVLNCRAYNVHGGSNTVYPVLKWLELFLVEPSLQRNRTDANDVYVEIIGETQVGANQTAGQVVRRDVPYLIK
jgi:Flp pilus assembly protein TadG